MKLPWMDIILGGIILLYAEEGFFAGAAWSFFDFLKFVLSFLAALKTYAFAGVLLSQYFHIPSGIAKAIGFLILTFSAEVVLHIVLRPLFLRISRLLTGIWNYGDRIVGVSFGVLSGFLFLMILLNILVGIPVSPVVKSAISSSMIAEGLLSQTQYLEKSMHGVFGGATQETLNFLTVKPDSNSLIKLNFTASGTIDHDAEQKMLSMVNSERVKRNLSALASDTKLQDLAREHGFDMLKRGYFSHYTPEGLTPFDRMNNHNIIYRYAGENLAFSPDVFLAMQGLMDSPGHKENILFPHFRKAGIGVVDGGIYGKMFIQEFTD